MKKNAWKFSVLKRLTRHSFILLAVWLNLALNPFARVIDVKLVEHQNHSQIKLILDQPYQGLARIEGGQGIARVGFYNLAAKQNIAMPRATEKLAQVNLATNGAELIVELQLASLLQETRGLIDYQIQDDSLVINLWHNRPALTAEVAANKLANIDSNVAFASLVSGEEGSLGLKNSALKLAAYTFLILLACLLVAVIYQKAMLQKKQLLKPGAEPKLLKVFHLSAKQKLWLLKIKQQTYALAVSPQAVEPICRLASVDANLIKQLEQTTSMAAIKAHLLESDLNQQGFSGKEPDKTGMQLFKTELQKKLAKLSPLR